MLHRKSFLPWLLLAAVTAAGVWVLAQEPAPKAPVAEEDEGCPACGYMMMRGGPATQPSEKMMEAMKEAGVTQEMMTRCRTVMQAPMYLDGPGALHARAEELGLTAQQKTQLEQIMKDARDKGLALLTAEQKAKLGAMPDKPVSAMQMHMEMHEKMMPVMQKRMREGKPDMGCPMMRHMMRRDMMKAQPPKGQ